ncbi:ABC transporter substrate-binding protein [Bradyrhizobium tropiciagri]|uniref:ABC transporter substrate-binding protein n=1 Tax=Bradyrhizobium tropiciagri TaxID=312253 RepID=UPI000AFA17D9|nr:ABC transporter substrate-binding protein [Bradyrhizobium tropiciagri]
MRRRDFIAFLSSAAAAWPLTVRGQRPSSPLIGVLSSGPAKLREDQSDGLRRGLKEAGFVEGENLSIEYRGADDHYDRLPALAAELVSQSVAVIATAGGPVAALAAKSATNTIPIVFAAVSDPVKSGLVASLNRPGGNVTGNAGLTIELDAKRLELLSELTPRTRVIGALVNANRPGVDVEEHDLLEAAKKLGRELVILRTADGPSIESAFDTLAKRDIAGLVVGADALFNDHRQQVVSLAARYALAGVYPWREYVTAGGLLSYGANLLEGYRLSGLYVGRILKGEKPADLPVVQPQKFELAINLRTAKTLAIDIPPAVIARADEVIE